MLRPSSNRSQSAPLVGLRELASILCLALLAATTGCKQKQYKGHTSHSIPMLQGDTVSIELERCSVKVLPGTDKECRLAIDKTVRASDEAAARTRFEEETFVLSTNSDGVNIVMVSRALPAVTRTQPQPEYKVVLFIPKNSSIKVTLAGGGLDIPLLSGNADLRTLGGGIVLGDIQGRLDAETGGGSITVKRCGGPAELTTTGGGIKIEDAMKSLQLKSTGGPISITTAHSTVKAETIGGKISIEELTGEGDLSTSGGGIYIGNSLQPTNLKTMGGSIEVAKANHSIQAQTSGGSIKATLMAKDAGAGSFQTTGGSITLYFAEGVGTHLLADTIGGAITTAFPLKEMEKSKNNLVADLHDGGPDMTARAFGGSVFVRKLSK